ncbi:MAG TPA: polyprenyl synthetase family protein [Polyangiaceae bacterium]|jgi:geranylgeranyl diphosphate synthase type I
MSMQQQTEPRAPSFATLARATKTEIDSALAKLAHVETAKARALSPDAGVVIEALFELATRGGKRLRPALVAAAYVACGGESGSSAVTEAGVALEVLQAYLLIHDDWMDNDDVRRGGPSVHAALRRHFGERALGDSFAILAGDYAQGLALDVISRARVPAPRMVAAMRELASMLTAVVTGQILDVRGNAKTPAEVETIHRLKTSSYTTRSPLALGAILAGADPAVCEGLRAAGDPMGVAFQLQDDLLGTFGDPKKTGKSARSDLRQGKRTALVAELSGHDDLLARALGVADASDADVDAVLRLMVDSGAKTRVEARRAALVAEASSKIERLPISSEGKQLLLGAASALAARED